MAIYPRKEVKAEDVHPARKADFEIIQLQSKTDVGKALAALIVASC